MPTFLGLLFGALFWEGSTNAVLFWVGSTKVCCTFFFGGGGGVKSISMDRMLI
jgi:hypothetical protein